MTGTRVLVTRPASQAEALATLIEQAGGTPVRFPTLTIAPIRPPDPAVAALSKADLVIFISANAAAHGYPFLDEPGGRERRIIAVGRATRAALERAGCRDVYDPGPRSSSEDLLAQPILHDVSGKHVCIVRGQGGREMLRETLASRGARVAYLECYRRDMPRDADTDALVDMLEDTELDDGGCSIPVVTSTSNTGLSNLLRMTPARYRARLLDLPLVVIGARQEAAARREGWLGPVLAAGAGNEQLVETLIAWRRERTASP